MKKATFLFLTHIILTSCNSSDKTTKITSSIAAEELTDEELKKEIKAIETEEKERIKAELENRTSISFEKKIHEFGKVKADTDNKYKFKFTNTGLKPLIISSVKASCGCTTPYKPEHPILPGKTDFIEVSFHPKKSQLGEISKTITVEANIESKLTELEIKAIVSE